MTTCTLCKRKKTVFVRPYSGEKLCRECFHRSIESKVRGTISKYGMLEPKDKIMVALSGGKDSVTLLHVLTKIEKVFPNTAISAVTIDEGIKEYRGEALKIATKNCRKLGVEHVVTSFKEIYGYNLDDIAHIIRNREEKGLSLCAYCGVLRRRALNTAAREAGVDKLATAHSLDDETQTMILNIIHGDVLRIARAKPVLKLAHPKLVQRIKPLCEVPEKEVAFWAYLKRIDFQSVPCPYARTALRNDIRTMLNRMEEKHVGTKFVVFRSIEKIRQALEAMAEEANLRNCGVCGEPTVGDLCKPCLMLRELGVP